MLITVVGGAIRVSTPYLFVNLGETLTEKGGRVNLGLEGILVMGAMSGYGTAVISGQPWLGVFAAGCAGAGLVLVHGLICNLPRVNDIAVGISLFIFGTGLAFFLENVVGAEGAMRIPGRASEQILVDLERDLLARSHVAQDPERGIRDLGANVVPAKREKFERPAHPTMPGRARGHGTAPIPGSVERRRVEPNSSRSTEPVKTYRAGSSGMYAARPQSTRWPWNISPSPALGSNVMRGSGSWRLFRLRRDLSAASSSSGIPPP